MTEKKYCFDFNVNGAERRRLVDIIGAFTQCDKKYLGAPSFAYEVSDYTIDKNGVVYFDDTVNEEELEGLLEILAYEGFVALTSDYGLEETDDDESNEDSEDTGFSISLPSDKVNTENLTKLFEAKGVLIKKALGIDSSPIIVNNDIVTFPWFKEIPTPDEIAAYTHFITAICEMTKKLKRINTVEKETDNEKYAFRCFLLRLGFIGAEYKTERKILLRNLEGSAAFKSPVTEKTYKVELDNDRFKIFTAKNEREAQSVAFEIAKENNSEFCEVSEVTE